MPDVRMIAAIGRSGQLGLQNDLPWPRNSDDLKWFKEITMGHQCIAGYNTFHHLPPLPGRTLYLDDAKLSPEEFLRSLNLLNNTVYVIGGSKTYSRWLPITSKLYLGLMDFDGEADTYFPRIY